jgi:hypothetical protein
MMKVGDLVMVRDPWIIADYHVPQARIVEVKECPVLHRKTYLLEFVNGKREWFDHFTLKVE